ncbi:integral membrane protein [Actinopolymorpha cephalotaxi]|uniref:Integral membrane protein n=1 Tax=Actinopolymorpha cephalotaxi TaxID=504797 RepID=A0A1I2VZ43_9ACTN|nr:DUF3817 domain-containing protein [Actinopolymorpha cephalotaxi]NYH82830.1 integral membrane protein [Actinopolymorpha cephalotaxi]SFG94410.1 integral membrane protein [Actinopolymorpha cephalotaxi]
MPLLTVYRVMSYVTGVVLLALVLVAMPLKYFADTPGPTMVVGQLHGFLYMAYVVVVLLLGFSLRWRPVRMLLVMLAGTIPFAAFFAERRIVADVRREQGAGGREGGRRSERVGAGD